MTGAARDGHGVPHKPVRQHRRHPKVRRQPAGPGAAPFGLLRLQQTAGNRAVTALLRSTAVAGPRSPRRRLFRARPIRVQRRGQDLDAEPVAIPERTTLRLTGGYEALDPGGHSRITMQFNQAGYHLQGWYQRRISRTVGGLQRQTMEQLRISADMVSDAGGVTEFQYRVYEPASGRTDFTGSLAARAASGGAPRLTMTSGSWRKEFERTSTSTRPPQEAIEALPEGVRDVLEASISAPLDRDEQERLGHNLEVVKRRIRDFWRESSHIAQMGPASLLNGDIGTIFTQHAPQQQPLVRQRVMENLMRDTFTHRGNERSYWNWLQLLVITHPNFTGTVQSRLGFTPEGGSTEMRTYRYAINLAGVSGDLLLGGGVMGGTFEIEYLGSGEGAQDDTTPVWRRELGMGIVQVSGGASAGITTGLFTPWTTFETPYPWEPQNFNGPLLIGQVQASASAGGGGGGSAGVMTIWGDRSLPALVLPGAGALAEIGLHAGAEAGGTAGWIGGTDQQIRARLEPPPEVRGEAAYTTSGALHFEVDEPDLTPDGMEEIRRFAALHLATLENPTSELAIEGYTSTTGTDEHNERLSRARARHVLQYIKDVTPTFALSDDRITTAGHGKTAARDAGEPENTENVAWRRVDIKLNGRIVLTLD